MTGRQTFIVVVVAVVSLLLGLVSGATGQVIQGALTFVAMGVSVWAGYTKWEPKP
jgi:hypothetical protein